MVSSVLILIAMCLAGASLSKEVKWNVYNNPIDYGTIYYLDAYQTLWTSYDAWSGNSDQKHMQTFKPIRNGKDKKKSILC